jgi:hypothetical protein
VLIPTSLPLIDTTPQVTFTPEFFMAGFVIGLWIRYLVNLLKGVYRE